MSTDHQSVFDTVFYPGGHRPLWDLAQDKASIALTEAKAAAGKPVAAVCHAPAALRHVKAADDSPLVKCSLVTGFSNIEEETVGLTAVVRWAPTGSHRYSPMGSRSPDKIRPRWKKAHKRCSSCWPDRRRLDRCLAREAHASRLQPSSATAVIAMLYAALPDARRLKMALLALSVESSRKRRAKDRA